jgi:hypothetical protein
MVALPPLFQRPNSSPPATGPAAAINNQQSIAARWHLTAFILALDHQVGTGYMH